MPNAMGTMARTVVSVVIIMGRIRRGQAFMIAVSRSSPICRRILIYSTKMMELFTTVPASMIKDTREIMDRSRPVRGRANSAPVKATGRISITITGIRKDSNCAARTKYTRPMATSRASSRSEKFSVISE